MTTFEYPDIQETLADESGLMLLVVMVVLFFTTLIAYSAIHNAAIELRIAGNDRQHRRAFYKAETAATEGAAALMRADTAADLAALVDDGDADNWQSASAHEGDAESHQYRVRLKGPTPGESTRTEGRGIKTYTVRGRYKGKDGLAVIEVDVRKASI
ncbi:MAG: hypothetical protein CSA22_06975 [Deltaproteobacteria bacterium]|nr:MAG: hypothetical protein CSA22_06975 [Deltaproteobacteria bacterium]